VVFVGFIDGPKTLDTILIIDFAAVVFFVFINREIDTAYIAYHEAILETDRPAVCQEVDPDPLLGWRHFAK
jgi:hypothetical protein